MIRKRKSLLKNAAAAVLSAVLLCSGISASAATVYTQHGDIPYDTYTYWHTTDGYEAVYTKPMYAEPVVLNAHKLGVADYKSLVDVSVSADGYIYLLDGDQSRITVLDSDYKVYTELYSIGGNSFAGAKGIFAQPDGDVYIADTENARVLISDRDGMLKGIITLPESPLIPEDFAFRPIKLAVDRNGYTYILSDGSYYGAILYSPSGEFLGFYGANTVKVGIAQAITKLWEKLTMTNEKYAQQISKLPFQLTDMYIDRDNFIYTATGKTEENSLQTGVIKMLSPAGSNILNSDSVAFGEKSVASSGNAGMKITSQNIAGLAIDANGFIYTYDTTYSRIYVYDSECNMLNAFGTGMNYGRQQGTFQLITAIDLNGDDVIATDGVKNTLTVFRCTDYGKSLKALQRSTLDGDYEKAKTGWEQVHISDSNNQFAYVGLAKAAYTEGDYKTAMELAKTAYDTDTYSLAFKQVRKEYLRNNFTWMFIAVLAAAAVVTVVARLLRKRGVKPVTDERTRLFLNVTFHPAALFTEMKQKKLTSMKWSFVALILFYLSSATQQMFGSFVFVAGGDGSFNSVMLLLKTVGFVALWTVTNWGVCALFGGTGKAREIFTVVCYSLIPLIIGNFGYTILTHILVPDEAAFLTVIMTVLRLYTLIMIVIGTIVIHDFSFGRFIGTSLLTLLGMAIVLFVGILIIILVQQLVAFLSTVFNEIVYR